MAQDSGTPARPGFASLTAPRVVAWMWVATAALAALFVALGWSLLQLGIALVPLLLVTIAMTVSLAQRREARGGR